MKTESLHFQRTFDSLLSGLAGSEDRGYSQISATCYLWK